MANQSESVIAELGRLLIEWKIRQMTAEIKLTRMTLPETIGAIAQMNATLEVHQDKLLVRCPDELPDRLRSALQFHKPALLKYLSAFSGQRWPTIPQKGL